MNSINPQVFEFFNRLSENNNREWFEQHKPEFKNLELGVKEFGSHLFDQISAHGSLEHSGFLRNPTLVALLTDFIKKLCPRTRVCVNEQANKNSYSGNL
ncbi:MAG: DUF2461 family protein [Flavobacteriales bacterium]|mgnify:CR=1 FL=1|jgi:hypothetical protein|nr:DUF2461 family protein [Flavobacteriales bacterium]